VSCSEPSSQPAGGLSWEARHDPAPAELDDHLLQVCVLLLLREIPAAGGDVRERLRPLGFDLGARAVERALVDVAVRGLVAADGADARAVYVLTEPGERALRAATADLRRTQDLLGGFLARCSERLVAGS
jgi:DNA-binding PadR family transcriptional regulator